MPDETTGTAPAGEDEGTPEGTPEAPAEDPTAKLIEDYRKRQAGAEKARQEAERLLREAQAEIEVLKAPKAPKEGSEAGPSVEDRIAEVQTKLAKEYEAKLAKVTGDALAARFPTARAKFPEITDPVKLAELEALYSEPQEPPTPVGNNQQRTGGPKNIEDMTAVELKAYMAKLDPSVMGLPSRS